MHHFLNFVALRPAIKVTSDRIQMKNNYSFPLTDIFGITQHEIQDLEATVVLISSIKVGTNLFIMLLLRNKFNNVFELEA